MCVCMCFSNIILFILFGFLAWSPPSSPASAFAKPVSARCRRNCCRNCAYKMPVPTLQRGPWTINFYHINPRPIFVYIHII